MNAPTPDDEHAMRDALQQDAARVPEPPFDAALHYATMRRLRTLADAGSARPRFGLQPALAAGAVILGLAAVVALWPSHSSPPSRLHEAASSPHPPKLAPRASLLAYQGAADDGEATLFAMLDRDAATLLPASSPVFDAAAP